MKLAVPSPRDGRERFLFPNSSSYFDSAVWINVSIPAPPYWDPSIPRLNISARWGIQGNMHLPTSVFFQPWDFTSGLDSKVIGIGHHQLVMVIASPYARTVLRDSANSTGNALNLTMYQEPNHSSRAILRDLANITGNIAGNALNSSLPQEPSDDHGGRAYIQVVGCTVRNDNITATIDTKSRLMDPLTHVSHLIGPEAPHDDHAWDEFAWEATSSSGAEKQFLLAFTPSSAYNNTSMDPRTLFPIGNPETLLAQLLEGNLVSPFKTAPNALVNFQGALERLYASYLWNVNRLCLPFDTLQPYSEECGLYWGGNLFSPAEFQLVWPGFVLIVVQWRSVVSLICCVMMFFLGWGILGVTRIENHDSTGAQQATDLLGSAMVFSRGSRIPELVVAEGGSERARLNAHLTQRLRYVEQDDGLGGYLDIDDSRTAK
ncbi:hypothetical protein C8R43DRAFT_272466 [Mycena crocata]|nr:hypothetical protein C8R43DRAFT_272466 [Mycena crocata]